MSQETLNRTMGEVALDTVLKTYSSITKDLLLQIMKEREDDLPGIEVWVNERLDRFHDLVVVKAVLITSNVGNYSEENIYLTPEEMVMTREVGQSRAYGIYRPFAPAWYQRREVEPMNYLNYASRSRDAIREAATSVRKVS